MRVWSYAVRERDKTSISDGDFDGGYVNAETFDEALSKIREYIKEAWGDVKLEITKVEYEHAIQLE